MTSADQTLLLSALVLGFAGSGHCLGMCGGIAGALGQGVRGKGIAAGPVLLGLGRISSYATAGAIAGGLGGELSLRVGAGVFLRVLAGVLILVFGLHAIGLRLGTSGLEGLGLRLWRKLLPFVRRIGPADRPWKAFALGATWGWLPCGLVYSALAVAAASGGATRGALFMGLFGLGTLPAMTALSALSGEFARWLGSRPVRMAAGLLMIAFGCWTIAAALVPGMHGGDATDQGHAHTARSSARIGPLLASVERASIYAEDAGGLRFLAARRLEHRIDIGVGQLADR